MIKIGKNDDILCLAVFGQLFFVPGLITLVAAIKAKESFWVQGVVTLVGAGVIAGTLIEKYEININPENPEKSFEPRSMKKKFIMNLLMGVGFTASGIYALVMYLIK